MRMDGLKRDAVLASAMVRTQTLSDPAWAACGQAQTALAAARESVDRISKRHNQWRDKERAREELATEMPGLGLAGSDEWHWGRFCKRPCRKATAC